jgi:hypothetical protein
MCVTAALAIAGAATSAYGYVESKSQQKKNEKAVSKQNAEQAKVAKQNQIAAQASQRAEKLRQQQMELDFSRRQRDIIRSAQAARSLGTARAVAQGASTGDTSAQASRQQNKSQQGLDVLSNLQNIMIGRGIFKENENIFKAQSKGAQYQTQANIYASQAQQASQASQSAYQLFGSGQSLIQNSGTFSNVFATARSGVTDLFGNSGGWQTSTSYESLK